MIVSCRAAGRLSSVSPMILLPLPRSNLCMLMTDYGIVTLLVEITAHAQDYLPNNDRNCQNARLSTAS